MKKQYLCLKNWEVNGRIHFEKGKLYDGTILKNRKSVKMKSPSGMKVDFHKGSEYFEIE